MGMDLLLLDNYDSFTYNLAHLIKGEFSGNLDVVREPDFNNLGRYDGIIISPGPGNPGTTPLAMKLLEKCYTNKPILGICLGMQCINEFFGGTTIKAPYPIHGKQGILEHNSSGIFNRIPNRIKVARYHSLIVKPSKSIEITSSVNDLPMSLKHSSLPIYGLQFHPESFLSEFGDVMIKNFLECIK